MKLYEETYIRKGDRKKWVKEFVDRTKVFVVSVFVILLIEARIYFYHYYKFCIITSQSNISSFQY
jgi:hypothetical protein